MGTNYGIKCNLFVSKMLIVDTIKKALLWKASLAQSLLPHNHYWASSLDFKEAYPQKVIGQEAIRLCHHAYCSRGFPSFPHPVQKSGVRRGFFLISLTRQRRISSLPLLVVPCVMEPPKSPILIRLSRSKNASPWWPRRHWQHLRRNWQVKPRSLQSKDSRKRRSNS